MYNIIFYKNGKKIIGEKDGQFETLANAINKANDEKSKGTYDGFEVSCCVGNDLEYVVYRNLYSKSSNE